MTGPTNLLSIGISITDPQQLFQKREFIRRWKNKKALNKHTDKRHLTYTTYLDIRKHLARSFIKVSFKKLRMKHHQMKWKHKIRKRGTKMLNFSENICYFGFCASNTFINYMQKRIKQDDC